MTKIWILLFTVGLGLGMLLVALLTAPPPPASSPELSPWQPPFTVVVDPGHGGHDPGAIVAGIQEKDITLEISLRVLSLAKAIPQLRVVLTRMSDRYPELRERVRFAEEVGAALYLSIHANSFPDPAICGVETLVDDSRPPDDPSWALAQAVQKAVCASTGAVDRGVRSQRLYMRHTHLPAALIEVGYLTCPAERARLLDPWYQEEIARGILRGIMDFLGP
jgi:N-acetylmuramoyl-L-alanine amidase